MNKTYELPKIGSLGSRRVVAEFDENGIAKITEQALDSLICELNEYAKRQKGHWIAVENEEMETIGYYCSKCDLPMETEEQTDYCPNCGCRMVEPQESEE